MLPSFPRNFGKPQLDTIPDLVWQNIKCLIIADVSKNIEQWNSFIL